MQRAGFRVGGPTRKSARACVPARWTRPDLQRDLENEGA